VLDELNYIIDNPGDKHSLLSAIDHFYNCVVVSLHECSNIFIPKHKNNKFWWSQELEELKINAISSCRAWKEAGKPKYGVIFTAYKKDKLLYKKRIREERNNETTSYTNDLHEALMKKMGMISGRSGTLSSLISHLRLFK